MISDLQLVSAVGTAPASLRVVTPALCVPSGAVGGTTAVVKDIRRHLAQRQPVARWEQERELFDRLPVELRVQVKTLQCAMLYALNLTTGPKAIKVQPACRRALEVYPQFEPIKTFRGKFDRWSSSRDWLLLVDRAKAGAEWQDGDRGLPEAFLDYVARRMSAFKRGDATEQAILSIKRQWELGRTHTGAVEVIPGYEVLADGTPWEKRPVNLIPEGWSSDNIRQQLKKRAKWTKAQKALAHHGTATARAFLPQTHGTRAGLRFLEVVQFDDVRCDFRVIDTDSGQVNDLWLLVARDVATSMLLGFGMRPARARDDGTQEHLKLQDMKQLSGWLLETYGLPPYRMTWKIEHGTATLSDATAAALRELVGAERLHVSYSSMIGGTSPAGFAERGVGNSKGKAMLESLNRLMHLMTSHFPGQIGQTYGHRPADALAREREALDIWQQHRPEDREQLAYPFFTIPQARTRLFEVFALQNQRTDHSLEGFAQVAEWYDEPSGLWRPAHTAPAGSDFMTRVRRESPLERAERLVAEHPGFTRVSPEVITAFYEHTQRNCRVSDKGEIEFTHESKILRFAPPSTEFALAPETKCLGYFNPDDPRFLTITDARGGILGTWLRRGLVQHGDQESLAEAIRYSQSALQASKARARDLAADEVAALEAMRQHNHGFVRVAEVPALQSGRASGVVATNIATRFDQARSERRATERRQQDLAKFAGDATELLTDPAPETHNDLPSDEFSPEGLL